MATTKPRVLVIDDDIFTCMCCVEILNGISSSVDVAHTNHDAVVLSDSNEYDLIFIDYHMPDFNGCETSLAIRQGKKNKNAFIVALTSDDQNKILKSKHSFNALINKPLCADTIHALISNMHENKKMSKHVSNTMTELRNDADVLDYAFGVNQFNGSFQTYNDIIQKTHDYLDDVTRSFVEGFKGDNIEECRRIAHSLKGSMKFIGAWRVHGIAQKIEAALKNGDKATAMALFQDLKSEIDLLKRTAKDLFRYYAAGHAVKQARET